MSRTTMLAFTDTQLLNPTTSSAFLHQCTTTLEQMLTGSQQSAPSSRNLACLAGTHHHVLTVYKEHCARVANHIGTGAVIDALRALIVVEDVLAPETLWELLAYAHQLRGDIEEAESLRWMLATTVLVD